MNNLIIIVMSLVLYNPLEAGVLLLYSWFFKPNKIQRNKFNVQDFIIKCYLIGALNYLVQFLEPYFQNTVLYFIFLLITNFLLMPLILKIFGYKNNFLYIEYIMLIFFISLSIIIDVCKMPTLISVINSNFLQQLINNFIIRILQIILLLILYGGNKMIKKILKTFAQKNIGKMVASTARGYGETKLTKKLAKEVKESK